MSPLRSDLKSVMLSVARQRMVVVTSLVGVVALFGVAAWDKPLAQALIANSWPEFVSFQHHTLFEDGRFGGSDLGLMFQIACALVAIVAILKLVKGTGSGAFSAVEISKRKRLQDLGRFSLFITLSSIYSGVVLVQGLKFAMGRARPYLVLDDRLELYTPWYVFGPLTIFGGRYPGSFPSGHVASAAAFIGLLYVFGSDPKGKRRLLRAGVFLLCWASWLAMSLARIMGRDHWPTDCIAAGLLVMLSYALFAEIVLRHDREVAADTPWILSHAAWKRVGRLFFLSALGVVLLWSCREIVLAVTGGGIHESTLP